MPRPTNWQSVGVPDGLPRLYTEHEIARAFGLSTYAMYHLRRLGVVTPVAWGKRSLLYDKATVHWLLARHWKDDSGGAFIMVETERGDEYVF